MIRILPPEEAKKIAAGEVIDRPAALVRELIDNALDSGAEHIELSIAGGGIKKTEVIDDGCGMSREDLELCVKTHATSKIQSLDDLSRSHTLGFRGEALAAAAAVARLEILSSTGGREAWLLETSPDKLSNKVTQTIRTRGTSIRAHGLFDTIPARRRFLKREFSEAAQCRQIFMEKALAFPCVSFRFIQDQELKLNLLPFINEDKSALKKRFGELILNTHERPFLHMVETTGKGFTITILFGGPELYRRDRRQLYIFANNRRIQDYGLMQALEYGLAGFFPNGSHPVGAVFLEVNPALADFNIHPAKREVRFADSGAIHHCITAALRSYVQSTSGTAASGIPRENNHSFLAKEALSDHTAEPEPAYKLQEANLFADNSAGCFGTGANPQRIRLIGRVFGLFILAESGDKLYLIDQHAAHERILYDQFLSAPVSAQELLVPIPFTAPSEDDDNFLMLKKRELVRLGIILENEGGGSWRIDSLPVGWKTGDPVEEILALRTAGENFIEHWAAVLACRTAIKDGDILDNNTAQALAETVLAMSDETNSQPRCPHGRPLWTEINRDALLRAVRRIE
ncbi:MAG: DNA mismatch repair endonuclease MutL [Treponema sp.]|jgi:DNA mismatch repair protein MutL|nr:DNA mismatch repair endonuclease MutL [Treponema sp.]